MIYMGGFVSLREANSWIPYRAEGVGGGSTPDNKDQESRTLKHIR